MQHPDEGMIHTWLDGELPAEEAAALEAHVAECAQCKASVAEARGFIAASSRIIGTLDNVPSGVIPVAKPVKRVWYSTPQFRAAAAVLIVAGASFLVTRTSTQKATLAIPGNAVMADASTAEEAMSAPSPTASVAPMAAPPAAASNQALSKKEAVKPVTVAPTSPKAFAVLTAPVQDVDAAKISRPEQKVANEADFNGRGVRGGSASAVIGPAAVVDSNAALSGKVAGVGMNAADAVSRRRDFPLVKVDLKVIRVDSTATTRKTTYLSSSGSEVVLTEDAPSLLSAIVTGTVDEGRQRAAAAPTPTPAPPPAAAKASAPSAAMAQQAAVVNTISWVDPVTRRRYSLSGPVPVGELEAIKVRLLQPKQ